MTKRYDSLLTSDDPIITPEAVDEENLPQESIKSTIGRIVLNSIDSVRLHLQRRRMKYISRFPLPMRENFGNRRIPDYYDGPYYTEPEDGEALQQSVDLLEARLKAHFPERLEDQVAPPAELLDYKN